MRKIVFYVTLIIFMSNLIHLSLLLLALLFLKFFMISVYVINTPLKEFPMSYVCYQVIPYEVVESPSYFSVANGGFPKNTEHSRGINHSPMFRLREFPSNFPP